MPPRIFRFCSSEPKSLDGAGDDQRGRVAVDRGEPARGLLHEDAGVDHPAAGAAELLVDRDAEPAELGELRVDLGRVELGVAVGEALALLGRAALAAAEVADRLGEVALLVGEVEVHGFGSLPRLPSALARLELELISSISSEIDSAETSRNWFIAMTATRITAASTQPTMLKVRPKEATLPKRCGLAALDLVAPDRAQRDAGHGDRQRGVEAGARGEDQEGDGERPEDEREPGAGCSSR